ncbi:hypothetical protein BDP27DRAFT_1399738 [Rhodocollybia butyracea]|uniref:Uncharacterized protein n=1 Tax=Rhodocollybia butyracea TaxID=206335 RepID=A0A9P5Q314_9AGAR|nr:hypothetical protein BDP27DRAFT_1399738 [Rhodocollybia butyracea]
MPISCQVVTFVNVKGSSLGTAPTVFRQSAGVLRPDTLKQAINDVLDEGSSITFQGFLQPYLQDRKWLFFTMTGPRCNPVLLCFGFAAKGAAYDWRGAQRTQAGKVTGGEFQSWYTGISLGGDPKGPFLEQPSYDERQQRRKDEEWVSVLEEYFKLNAGPVHPALQIPIQQLRPSIPPSIPPPPHKPYSLPHPRPPY